MTANPLMVCLWPSAWPCRRQRIPSSPPHFPVPMSPSLPSARRPSRDSLRTLPSPRPAPSSALPEVPCEPKEPHSLSPIVIPSPSLFPASLSNRSEGGLSPTSFHAPLSAPPTTSLSSPGTSSSFVQTPPLLSPLSSPSYHTSRLGSFMSFSSTSPSFRTVRRRNMERSNALACLEGRSRTPGRVPRKVRQRNFMSMSDDEDEAAGDDEDAGGDADVEDDSDAPERPPRANTFRSSASSASPRRSPGRKDLSAGTWAESCSPVDEEEDRVLPAVSAIPSHVQAASSKPRSRSRRGTLESWFPLANFIDLKDDELQGWRGVVDINGLSAEPLAPTTLPCVSSYHYNM